MADCKSGPDCLCCPPWGYGYYADEYPAVESDEPSGYWLYE